MTLQTFDALPEVDRQLHLEDYDAELLKCPDCGRPTDICSDPEREWHPRRVICYPTRELAKAERRFKALHADGTGHVWHDGSETDWASKSTKRTPYLYDDGVTIFVDNHPDPDDDFLKSASSETDENGGDLNWLSAASE